MVDIGVGYFQGQDHFKVALDNQKKYQANWKPATFMLKEVCEVGRWGGGEVGRWGGGEVGRWGGGEVGRWGGGEVGRWSADWEGKWT